MATITNTHKTALGLPGITLQPNVPTPVHNWEELRKNHVVQAWLKAGILVDSDAPQRSKFLQADRYEVLAKLAAHGINPDRRTGVAKLQEMLAEAEKPAETSTQASVASDRAAVTNVPQEAAPDSGPFQFRG